MLDYVHIHKYADTPLHLAVKAGNLEIIKVLIEVGGANTKLINFWRDYPIMSVKHAECDDTTKYHIVNFLLPHTYTEDPQLPGHYFCSEIFRLVMNSCEYDPPSKLNDFLIDTLYAEQFNSLYPLIKKLRAASNHSSLVCAFLHDEIDNCEEYLQEFGSFSDSNYLERDIFGVLLDLIMKDSAKDLKLAVDTLKVLFDKNFNLVLKRVYDGFGIEDYYPVLMNADLSFRLKRLFHLLYSLLESMPKRKIYELIPIWFRYYSRHRELDIVKQSFQVILPFLIKPTHAKKLMKIFRHHKEQKAILSSIVNPLRMVNDDGPDSLEQICRNVIRFKIARVIHAPKDFISGIWSLNIPETIKCRLLHIPDSSWIEELKLD